jgi:four helix bundle protein
MLSDEWGEDRDLRARTKRFALRIISLHVAIKNDDTARVLRNQLLRSGTSVAAQYREACRARSRAEFISKIESATQELDESALWMELLVESGLVATARLSDLQREAEEIMSMLVSSAKTSKDRRER